MQRNRPGFSGFDWSGIRRDTQGFDAVPLSYILTAQLRDLTGPRPRVCANPRDQRRVAIAGVVVSLIALALLRISRISSALKAFVSRCRVFFGTGTEHSTNGFLAINRCLTAHAPTALRAVTQMFITVNALVSS
jgi:hypothetical protein